MYKAYLFDKTYEKAWCNAARCYYRKFRGEEDKDIWLKTLLSDIKASEATGWSYVIEFETRGDAVAFVLKWG